MASFFEKLKKGMGIEESGEIEEISSVKESEEGVEGAEEAAVSSSASSRKNSAIEEKLAKKKRGKKSKKIEVEEATAIPSNTAQEKASIEEKLMRAKAEQKKPSFTSTTVETTAGKKNIEVKEEWLEPEGELAIDVYQTESEIVIQSAIAGVKPENLDIVIERDILTIKGSREKPFEESGDYFTQECYWGPFSREVVMPVEVDPERVEATMKDGILIIRIPKLLREKLRKIKVKI